MFSRAACDTRETEGEAFRWELRRVFFRCFRRGSSAAGGIRITGVGGGVFAHVVLSRSRMTIDPHIPTMPARSTAGFHRPGRHRVHHARSAVMCSASRVEGELHPSNVGMTRVRAGMPHLTCTWYMRSLRLGSRQGGGLRIADSRGGEFVTTALGRTERGESRRLLWLLLPWLSGGKVC